MDWPGCNSYGIAIAGAGFEPALRHSECPVLPLDDPADFGAFSLAGQTLVLGEMYGREGMQNKKARHQVTPGL